MNKKELLPIAIASLIALVITAIVRIIIPRRGHRRNPSITERSISMPEIPLAAIKPDKKDEITEHYVLVSSRPIQKGDKITTGCVTWKKWPISAVQPHFIAKDKDKTPLNNVGDYEKAFGMWALSIIPTGVPITMDMLVEKDLEILAAKEKLQQKKEAIKREEEKRENAFIRKGMRAITFAVNQKSASSTSLLRPGDLVDILIMEQRGGQWHTYKYKALKILAIDGVTALETRSRCLNNSDNAAAAEQINSKFAENRSPPRNITLEIEKELVETMLRQAASTGVILSIRSQAEEGEADNLAILRREKEEKQLEIEQRQKEVEEQRQESERKRQEEEQRRKDEEQQRKDEEQRRKDEEQRRKDENSKREEQENRKREEENARKKQEEEMCKREEEERARIEEEMANSFIQAGMRAITFPVNQKSASTSNMLRPGNLVDILIIEAFPEKLRTHKYRAMKILAIDGVTKFEEKLRQMKARQHNHQRPPITFMAPQNITLEVKSELVGQMLQQSGNNGVILSLRSQSEKIDPNEEIYSYTDSLIVNAEEEVEKVEGGDKSNNRTVPESNLILNKILSTNRIELATAKAIAAQENQHISRLVRNFSMSNGLEDSIAAKAIQAARNAGRNNLLEEPQEDAPPKKQSVTIYRKLTPDTVQIAKNGRAVANDSDVAVGAT